MIRRTEIILYVEDQRASAGFYRALLRGDPVLDVPGMTEFQLSEGVRLGLMPNAGVARLLGPAVLDPGLGRGIPRCELYLIVDDAAAEFDHAIGVGATVVSPPRLRDWGDRAAYVADPDGHIVAFAEAPAAS
jgi:lactoylglutathione lyase